MVQPTIIHMCLTYINIQLYQHSLIKTYFCPDLVQWFHSCDSVISRSMYINLYFLYSNCHVDIIETQLYLQMYYGKNCSKYKKLKTI